MNSRFAALIEEEPIVKKVHQKNEKPNNIVRDTHRETFKQQTSNIFKAREDHKMVKKDIKISIDDLEMFPSLSTSINIETNTDKPTFIEKLKCVNDEIQCNDDNILKEGWVSLRRDDNNQIIYEYSKIRNNYDDNDLDWETITKKLNENYERWKKQYISTWGQDEFEKMYKFPNYDYFYFDKLDEEYENEMLSLLNQDDNDSSDYYENLEYENDDYY